MTDRPTVANVAYLAVNAGQQWLQNLETEEKTKEKTANLHGTYLSYGTKYQKHESWDDDDALRSNVGDDGGDGGDGDSTVTQRHMSSGHNGNSKHTTHTTHHTHSLSLTDERSASIKRLNTLCFIIIIIIFTHYFNITLEMFAKHNHRHRVQHWQHAHEVCAEFFRRRLKVPSVG